MPVKPVLSYAGTTVIPRDEEPHMAMRCLRCGFTDAKELECPRCHTLTAAVYLGGQSCRECALKADLRAKPEDHHETYTVSDTRVGTYMFDVTQAQLLTAGVSYGHLVDVPEDYVLRFLQVNVTEPRHYPHIPDPQKPGIVAEIEITPQMTTYVLLDGSHRAARLFLEGKTFRAHFLSWAAIRSCVLEFRPGSLASEL